MKIAVYVSKALYPPENGEVVSGHVQVALKTYEALSMQEHDVTLITTKAPAGYKLPSFINSEKAKIKFVASGTREWPNHKRINLLGTIRFLSELRKLLIEENYNVLHFVGSNKNAYLLTLLKVLKVKGKTIITFSNYRKIRNPLFCLFIRKLLIRNIDVFITSTQFLKDRLEETGFRSVHVNRPGILKKDTQAKQINKLHPKSEGLVLFWRDAEYSNGVDICIKVFGKLSSEFKKIDFVFAVRPKHTFEGKLKEVDKRYKNIHLLLYPYKRGITIEKLLASSICVVMPFRKLSLNPQMALLETLAAGKSLITTNIESNSELIDNEKDIIFIKKDNVEETYNAVRSLLNNRSKAEKMGKRAQSQVLSRWNWDKFGETLKNIYKSEGLTG